MPEQQEQLIKSLESTGDFRVLRRFAPVQCYAPIDGVEGKLKTLCVVDTETTGLDKTKDKIIEVGYVLARFNPGTGLVHDIVSSYCGMQDPGSPLPGKITQLTGITDADVAGKSFDRERIEADFARADLMLAHNASFDRGFLEMEFPALADKWWACSIKEGPWDDMMTGSSKLEYLAYKVAGVFYEAHRAVTDAEVLLHLLTCDAHDGQPVFGHILKRCRQTTYRVWAVGAPYDKKDHLKTERGYKWSDGADPQSPIKAWVKDGILGKGDLDAELLDLGTNVYTFPGAVTVDELSGRERYSERYLQRQLIPVAFSD